MEVTLLDPLADDSSRWLPKSLQLFAWNRLREVDFNYLESSFLLVELLGIRSLPLDMPKCNELSISNTNSIQPLQLVLFPK